MPLAAPETPASAGQTLVQPGRDTPDHAKPTQQTVASALESLYHVQVSPDTTVPVEAQTPVSPDVKTVAQPVHTDDSIGDFLDRMQGRPGTEKAATGLKLFLQKLHLQNPDGDIQSTN